MNPQPPDVHFWLPPKRLACLSGNLEPVPGLDGGWVFWKQPSM